MKYQISLTGGKNLVVDQIIKEKVERLLKDNTDKWINIGNDSFKVSTIKGIFEFRDDSEKLKWWTEDRREDEKEWSDELFRISKKTPEEKTEHDLKTRIFPGLRLSKINSINKEIKEAILDFFKSNPNYPRCPSKVWWPLLKSKLITSLYISRWFNYIFRNDEAIENWARFNRIKIIISDIPIQVTDKIDKKDDTYYNALGEPLPF